MLDKARQLAEELLRLAQEQDRAVVAADWDRFTVLSGQRETVTAALMPFLDGRQDLRPLLTQVLDLDVAHRRVLQEAHRDTQAELATLQPQQTAMRAYFSGVSAGHHEARFIDKHN